MNKKKQKNFDSRWRFQHHAKRRKSFLVLFFKKERLTLVSSGLPLSSDSVLLVSVQVAGHGSAEPDGGTAALQRGNCGRYGISPREARRAAMREV